MRSFFRILMGGCLLLALAGGGSTTLAQSCTDCRYLSYVFDSVDVQTVRFGEGQNAQGQSQTLYMDVYQPVGDTAASRPVVIFAFGGGFIQGSRTDGYVIKACERFARAGYVAASIDYRIGFDPLGIFPNPAEELMRVFFRAMQDMRGSVQYMRAHADSMGNTWRLDTNRIVVGGASAGAITALMVTYCDKDTEFAEIGSLSALNSLGGFYTSSGDYPGYSWETYQVINIAGALVNSEWIETGDPPVVSYHGDQDQTVPYQGGNFDLGFSSVGLEGSYLVDQEAQAKGVCSYLYTLVGGDHPSGSMSDEEIDDIFNRFLPRMHARLMERSYCCQAGVSISPSGVVPVNPGQPVTLNAVTSGGTGNETLQWCGIPCNFSGTGDSVVVTPSLPQYYMLVSYDSACQATDFVTMTNAVGVNDGVTEGSRLTVMPNPGQNQIRLDWEGESTLAELEIRDLRGRVVLVTTYDRNTTLNTDRLEPGIYIISARTATRTDMIKWIKVE